MDFVVVRSADDVNSTISQQHSSIDPESGVDTGSLGRHTTDPNRGGVGNSTTPAYIGFVDVEGRDLIVRTTGHCAGIDVYMENVGVFCGCDLSIYSQVIAGARRDGEISGYGQGLIGIDRRSVTNSHVGFCIKGSRNSGRSRRECAGRA